MKYLNDCKFSPNVYGLHKLKFNHVEYETIIMKMVGPNLMHVFNQVRDEFTIETCCMIGQKMIKALKAIHSKCILHGDLNPVNFCFASTDVNP